MLLTRAIMRRLERCTLCVAALDFGHRGAKLDAVCIDRCDQTRRWIGAPLAVLELIASHGAVSSNGESADGRRDAFAPNAPRWDARTSAISEINSANRTTREISATRSRRDCLRASESDSARLLSSADTAASNLSRAASPLFPISDVRRRCSAARPSMDSAIRSMSVSCMGSPGMQTSTCQNEWSVRETARLSE